MPTPCGFGFMILLNYRVSHLVSSPNTYMVIRSAEPLSSMSFFFSGINVADADNQNKGENFPHSLLLVQETFRNFHFTLAITTTND